MIDLSEEASLSLTQAARLLPPGRGDRPVTLSCLLRWILRGARAPSGQLVRLEAVRVGGRWITSKEALQRFAEALTPSLDNTPPTPRPPSARRRASERAIKQLEKMGI
jgi:hypothetical protein